MIDTANFFWQGNLTTWEIQSMKSFSRHGWKVQLWSYDHYDILDIDVRSADEIMPRHTQSLYKYKGNENNPAAWSEFFRIQLLIKEGGWWFDADCVCLKDVEQFHDVSKNRPYVLGFENPGEVNNAVHQFNDVFLAQEMLDHLNIIAETQYGIFLEWGEIGFKHITDFLIKKNLLDFALPKNVFYPIDSTKISVSDLLDPAQADKKKLEDSLVLHYWNKITNMIGADKTRPPPHGSLLDSAMKGEI